MAKSFVSVSGALWLACALTVMTVSKVHGEVPPISVADRLAEFSLAHRLLVLGEMHGSREVPALVLATAKRLLDKKQSVVVALEMPARLQSPLSDFLVSDDAGPSRAHLLDHAFWTWLDGRSSEAMLALIEGLRDLRRSGHAVAVFAFDADTAPSGTDREREMAENLRTGYGEQADARFIVLTGNYHARVQKGAPWDSELELMAYQLRDLAPLALNVTAPIGRVWVCNPECGYYAFGVGRPIGKAAVKLFDTLSDAGYSGEVVLPSFSASPPARK